MRVTAWLVAAALLALVGLGLVSARPPAVAPAVAPAGEFSAERARAHVEALAAAPRPPATEAHRKARAYLLERLAELGVPAEVQRASVVDTRWGVPYDAARPENVVGRIAGTDSSGAVALIAHYDSVPHSPGASDDASGVAALLEAVRALRSQGPLRNDVIVLFTDAEEGGALGAKAFVRDELAARDIQVALNFDTRGAGGPALMFDTSAGNGWLVRQLAEAVPDAVASSFSGDVARRLGHSTDMAPFKAAGVPAMNFGFFDEAARYHTGADAPAHLDLRSVQHLGDHALALARQFGGLDLRAGREAGGGADAVYFHVPGLGLVVHGRAWVALIAGILAALLHGVARRAVRRGAARPRRILAGLGVHAAALVGAAAAAAGVVAAMRRLHPALGVMRADPYDPAPYRIGVTLLALAVVAGVYRAARSRIGAGDLALGAMLGWLLLVLVTSVLLPGGSYLFAWPLAGALLGFAAVLARAHAHERAGDPGPAEALILIGAAAPGLLLAAPVVAMLFAALQLPMAAAPALVVALVAGLLLPHLELLGGGRSRAPALALGAAAALSLGVGLAGSRFDEARPRPSSLAYGLDAPSGKAHWMSTDAALDPWVASFFTAETDEAPSFPLPGQGRVAWQAAAPHPAGLPLAPPVAELLEDTSRDGVRTLRLRLASARGAPWLMALVTSEVEVLGAAIDGERVDEGAGFRASAANPWGFAHMGVPAEGIVWSVETRGPGPVEIRIVDRSYALPAELLPSPRPRTTVAAPFRFADSVFVAQVARF